MVKLMWILVGQKAEVVCAVPQGVGQRLCRVGQNRTYIPYMTVYLVISLQKLPYIHRIYMVLGQPYACASGIDVAVVGLHTHARTSC